MEKRRTVTRHRGCGGAQKLPKFINIYRKKDGAVSFKISCTFYVQMLIMNLQDTQISKELAETTTKSSLESPFREIQRSSSKAQTQHNIIPEYKTLIMQNKISRFTPT